MIVTVPLDCSHPPVSEPVMQELQGALDWLHKHGRLSGAQTLVDPVHGRAGIGYVDVLGDVQVRVEAQESNDHTYTTVTVTMVGLPTVVSDQLANLVTVLTGVKVNAPAAEDTEDGFRILLANTGHWAAKGLTVKQAAVLLSARRASMSARWGILAGMLSAAGAKNVRIVPVVAQGASKAAMGGGFLVEFEVDGIKGTREEGTSTAYTVADYPNSFGLRAWLCVPRSPHGQPLLSAGLCDVEAAARVISGLPLASYDE
jgi:hypothetical protein